MTTEAGIVRKANRGNLVVPKTNEIILKLQPITNTKHKMMFTFLYLYGNRIEELVGIRNPDKKSKDRWLIEPIRRHQIEIKKGEDDRDYLKVSNMVILKREVTPMGRLVRNIELPINVESELIQPLIAYVNTLQPNDALFDYHPAYAWELAKKYLGNQYFPHFFRHTRATRLASDYGFNSLELAAFFGWKDSRMASHYAHLNTQDLSRKIR